MALVAVREAPLPIQPGGIDVAEGEGVAFVVVIGPVPGHRVVDLELQVVVHHTSQPQTEAVVAGPRCALRDDQVAHAVVAVRAQAG